MLRPARVPFRNVVPQRGILGVFDGHVHGAVTEDERFEKGVAGQAVRSVKPRARHLATCKQAADGRATVMIGSGAPALIVRRGYDRNRLLRDVDSVAEAGLVDVGEVFADHLRGAMGYIEQDVCLAPLLELIVDGSGHDVARRQLLTSVVGRHEPVASLVIELPARSPYRLGDQEGVGLRMVERRRMKLNEFHIGDASLRSVDHRHPIACGHVRIRRMEIYLAGASAGKEGRPGQESLYPLTLRVVDVGTVAVNIRTQAGDMLAEVMLGDELDRKVVLVDIDVGMCARIRQKRPFDLAARRIGRVHDAVRRMPSFPAEMQAPVPLRKLGSQRHQLLDPLRTFLDDEADDLGVAQARAGLERVIDVTLEGILGRHHGRDAALRIVGVRLDRLLLRDDRHRPIFGDREGIGETRHAAADN